MATSKLLASRTVEAEDLEINMSPMIDMVFLLLLFFLVNASMIIVKQDVNVEPPVAINSVKAKDGTGRIVINIYKDGTFYTEDSRPLATDAAITNYIKDSKERIKGMGYEPKLHLRGDRESVFKYCRKIIRLSADAGVEQILFATYNFQK